MFVTVFLGLLDTTTGLLAYINAGHPAPHVLHASGQLERISGKPEMPFGVRSKVEYHNEIVALQPGDTVFVISDGVVEAMNAEGAFYTLDRLNAVLQGASGSGAGELVRNVVDGVNAFTGSAPKADDVTVLALRWRPSEWVKSQT